MFIQYINPATPETIEVTYNTCWNNFSLKIGDSFTVLLSQEEVETLYSESFGAMLHADEKAEA